MRHEQKIKLLSIPSRIFSVQHMMRPPAFPVIFPFWHSLSDEPLPHIQSLYQPYNISQFKKSLDGLLKHFIPVSIEDIVENNFKPGKFYMHISFDDGLLEAYQNAAPILKEKGIPASFFINPPFLGDKQYMFRYEVSFLIRLFKQSSLPSDVKSEQIKALLELKSISKSDRSTIEKLLGYAPKFPDRRIYMNDSEVQHLYKDGFHIGAHSMTHPLFCDIQAGEQKKEVMESLGFIQDNWPSDIRSFAFPYTDDGVSAENIRLIHQESGLSLSFGTAGYGKHPGIPHFQRIPMEHNKVFSSMRIIKTELLASFLKHKNR